MQDQHNGQEENNERTPEEFYASLKNELNKVENFPTNYTYKFIVPTENKKIAQIQGVFDNARPQFSMKESKTGKYTSITVVIFAFDADQVIHFYREVAKVDGVIML
ncbi:MAG: DUF493 domain-containing protein [Flavobacteriaceae bacterium]|nr:DUF493 domain-containing protein [Flavobacteriaceae bacterium]